MAETLFGIDYGSKLTGNTVIAIFSDMEVLFLDVDKGVDADNFILNAAKHFKPSKIFMDAPLSLPGVYRHIADCDNYHFRKADMELNAMSPMFLGGLAARAMELKDELEDLEIEVFETYPRILANRLNLKVKGYKGSLLGLKDCRAEVGNRFSGKIQIDLSDIQTWHHLDALLCLMSALNHLQGEGEVYGLQEEGQIYI